MDVSENRHYENRLRPELLDELLKDYQKPEDLLGQDGLLQQLTKALVERALDGELTHHLGYEKSPTPSWMKSAPGRRARSTPSTRSSTSTRSR
jgi:transposase-like protein